MFRRKVFEELMDVFKDAADYIPAYDPVEAVVQRW